MRLHRRKKGKNQKGLVASSFGKLKFYYFTSGVCCRLPGGHPLQTLRATWSGPPQAGRSPTRQDVVSDRPADAFEIRPRRQEEGRVKNLVGEIDARLPD